MKTFFAFIFCFISINAFAFEINGVPFIKQDTNHCGSASLSSIMFFYGTPGDQHSISEAVYCEKLKGSLIMDLENYARDKGFNTRFGCGTVPELIKYVNQGRPVIVLVDLGFWFTSKPHYLVVLGYTEDGIIAHSGYKASKFYRYSRFKKIWKKTGSTYLLIYP